MKNFNLHIKVTANLLSKQYATSMHLIKAYLVTQLALSNNCTSTTLLCYWYFNALTNFQATVLRLFNALNKLN